MDGTGELFEPFVQALGSEDEVAVLRYPPTADAGYDELVTAVLAALPRRGPFIIVAESFGGPLALKVAARRPAGLRGIVLCATFADSPLPRLPTWLSHLIQPFFFWLAPDRVVVRALLGRQPAPALPPLLLDALRATPTEVLAHRARAVINVNVHSDLADCQYPLLYVQATNDRVVGKHCLERILATRRTTQVVEIEAPHLVLQTEPEACVKAIRAFLATLPQQRGGLI